MSTEILSLKKILILSDWYEPGYKAGGPIQSIQNFVLSMYELFDIAMITSDTDLGEPLPYSDVPLNRWISRKPGIRIYYASGKLLNFRKIKDLIEWEKPDFIYLNSMYSIRYSIMPLLLLWRRKIHAQVVLSPRGMLRESAIKIKTNRKKLFIALLNRLRIPERIIFHATDIQEKKDILHYFPGVQKIMMVTNFSGNLPELLTPIKKIPGKLSCVFISRIMAIKNISFFLQVLKNISENIELQLVVYGEVEDEKYWQDAQTLISEIPKHITVSYHGPLPHAKVNQTLQEHHIFVLPTKGENFGHAIFEALSAGKPVLISDTTPWLGLKEKRIGWDISLADPESWISAIQEAASFDQEEYNAWSANARIFAKDFMERKDLKGEYIKLFS